MAKAIALTYLLADRAAEASRAVLVTACAVALIAAGQALPF